MLGGRYIQMVTNGNSEAICGRRCGSLVENGIPSKIFPNPLADSPCYMREAKMEILSPGCPVFRDMGWGRGIRFSMRLLSFIRNVAFNEWAMLLGHLRQGGHFLARIFNNMGLHGNLWVNRRELHQNLSSIKRQSGITAPFGRFYYPLRLRENLRAGTSLRPFLLRTCLKKECFSSRFSEDDPFSKRGSFTGFFWELRRGTDSPSICSGRLARIFLEKPAEIDDV